MCGSLRRLEDGRQCGYILKPEDSRKLNIRSGWPTILWMIPLRSSGGIAPTSVELLGNQAWDSSTALSILSFATVSSFCHSATFVTETLTANINVLMSVPRLKASVS